MLYFRQTSCLVEILRRPRDVVLTVVSRLRARWKAFRMGTVVSVNRTMEQSSKIDQKLEREALFVASLVSKIVEDSFPGRQVTVQAHVKGNPQNALSFLEQHIQESGKSD